MINILLVVIFAAVFALSYIALGRFTKILDENERRFPDSNDDDTQQESDQIMESDLHN